MNFVIAGAILKYFGAPYIKPERSSELPHQEAPGPSRSSGPPSVQEALEPSHTSGPQEASSAHLHVQLPVFSKPVDPADWPPVLSDSFRTDAVGKGPF